MLCMTMLHSAIYHSKCFLIVNCTYIAGNLINARECLQCINTSNIFNHNLLGRKEVRVYACVRVCVRAYEVHACIPACLHMRRISASSSLKVCILCIKLSMSIYNPWKKDTGFYWLVPIGEMFRVGMCMCTWVCA